MSTGQGSVYQKPEVYAYLDIHEYLGDMFRYLKHSARHFSIRKFSDRASISSGLIPGVMTRRFSLSRKTLEKIMTELNTPRSERAFLEWLRLLSESNSQRERLKAYKNICRHQTYKKNQ